MLVYDLARRLWNRDDGFAAGLALLATLQFVWQARQGADRRDSVFLTTLGLYGLLRHLLLGPSWGWYAVGWAAAGFGIITKGVGFLPVLLSDSVRAGARCGWDRAPTEAGCWRWALGPLAMVASSVAVARADADRGRRVGPELARLS